MFKCTATIAALAFCSSSVSAEELPTAFQGAWSTSDKSCDEDMPNGVVVLEVESTGLGFYEIGCRTSSIHASGNAVTMVGHCSKGGSTTEQTGRMQLRSTGPSSLTLEYQGYSFMADAKDTYYRCPSSASPPGQVEFMHNGSVVSLATKGSDRLITYSHPRPGMVAAGAKPGDLLFNGTIDGGTWRGNAAVFNKTCGRSEYPVTGKLSEDGKTITLTGNAPKLSPTCTVLKYVLDTLVFTRD
jgi:hypothetical protein